MTDFSRFAARWFSKRNALARRAPDRHRLELLHLEDRSVPAAGASAAGVDALRVDLEEYSQSHVLVQLRDGATGPVGSERLATSSNIWKVPVGAGGSVADALAALRGRAEVLRAQPDYRVHIADAVQPADGRYGDLWGMNNAGQTGGRADADIDALEVWTANITGSQDVIVAVIDSGIDYNHPDLAANMWQNANEIPGDGVDNDKNGYADDVFGYDFHNKDADPSDDNGHGTHVAGTIAAPMNGVGVVGVAPNVRVMAVKFLDANGSGDLSNALAALNYAWKNGAQISNNSWVYSGAPDDLFFAELGRATASGHLFVAAAGNGHWRTGLGLNNDSNAHYPTNYQPAADGLLSVAATDHVDRLTSFSNWGATTVDLAAPGMDVLSTLPAQNATAGDPSGYGYYSGTSMATPHVAGAAALLKSLNPNLTGVDIKRILMGTTDYIGNETYGKPTVTNGRLNVARAVEAARIAALPVVTVNDVMRVTEGSTARAKFTVSLSAPSDQTVTVSYATANDTAVAGSDYTAASGTVTFAPGQTTITVEVVLRDDTSNEPDETFFLTLSAPVNATVATGYGQGRAVIADNKPDPMYVWDIAWATSPGTGGTNLHTIVDVNSDSDVDGTAEAADAGVAGATVTLSLYHDTNGNGTYGDKWDKVWNGWATADSSGRAVFNLYNAPTGNYKAVVTKVTSGTLVYKAALNRETQSFYLGFPTSAPPAAPASASGASLAQRAVAPVVGGAGALAPEGKGADERRTDSETPPPVATRGASPPHSVNPTKAGGEFLAPTDPSDEDRELFWWVDLR